MDLQLFSSTDIRSVVFLKYTDSSFITAIGVSSFFVWQRSQDSLAPIILALTLILVYSRILFNRNNCLRNGAAMITMMAVAGTISWISPSLRALSTPILSVFILFLSLAVISALIVATVYLDTRICTHLGNSWSQITFFPTLWATFWCAWTYLSPVGRLLTWSTSNGNGFYGWIVPVLGPAGIDWIVSASAVVFSQAIGMWFIGKDSDDELILSEFHDEVIPRTLSSSRSSMLLSALLLSLSVPSFFINNIPFPPYSPDSTPITIGCVIPAFKQHLRHVLTLEDYIEESKKVTSSAKVLLWPEGAVIFRSEIERESAFNKIREEVTGSYVGVSFEEYFDGEESSKRRTGLALISKESPSPHLTYYKRHLVPIAESFSFRHATADPSLFSLPLGIPKNLKIPKSDWGFPPNYTRPIPITASICLDFSDPSPFAQLSSRPALILAPAHTWDLGVGIAMWQQAKQRSQEIGSMVLWCDGGDGGVSGIAGGGFQEFHQVGRGSWTKTIGISYPFNNSRTVYAHFGPLSLLIFWIVVGGKNIWSCSVFFFGRRVQFQRASERAPSLGRQPPSPVEEEMLFE